MNVEHFLVILNIMWLCDKASATSSENISPETQNAYVVGQFLAYQCNDHNAHIIHNFFIKNFNIEVVRSLYKQAIDHLLTQRDPEMIAAYVWHMYERNESKTNELMVELQLYLYDQLQRSNRLTDKYLTDVAYYIYTIKSVEFISNLSNDLKVKLGDVQSNLPNVLQEFYFRSEFCMSNKKYKEYAYSSRFVEGQIRKIYTWLNAITSSSQYIWKILIKQKIHGSATTIERPNVHIALKSESYGDFLYVDRERLNRVYGWVGGVPHVDSYWKVEFMDNSLVFEHDGLFFCSTNVIDNENVRRMLHGFSDAQYSKFNTACQWVVEKCPFEKHIIGHLFGALFL